ncbi:MAG: hypothetical protein PHU83_02045, partial [Eubacteriales bacterium]|nr:hypothetical protein [Eubacteriales bacterium]
ECEHIFVNVLTGEHFCCIIKTEQMFCEVHYVGIILFRNFYIYYDFCFVSFEIFKGEQTNGKN